jgi:CubicO group peptidase (beta-lactamase class C family)
MILAWVVEHVAQRRLDHFVVDEIYQPLGIHHLFFVTHHIEDNRGTFAATENCRWRRKIIEGQVHDENAYAVGGIEGHAGLFGTADDINRLLIELLFTYHGRTSTGLFQPDLLHQFFKRLPGTDKALGFDTPSPTGSSCGRGFSQNSIGHLGFKTALGIWDLPAPLSGWILSGR